LLSVLAVLVVQQALGQLNKALMEAALLRLLFPQLVEAVVVQVQLAQVKLVALVVVLQGMLLLPQVQQIKATLVVRVVVTTTVLVVAVLVL
jgi:hypothetical protein